MTADYEVLVLTDDDRERLLRTYGDLMDLASSSVPSVRSAARAAVAFVAQALNGQGIQYELYTERWGTNSSETA